MSQSVAVAAPPTGPLHGARHKTALVLAGGGVAGAVYEIGALRAINDMLIGRTVNDFDIYVGTSAGALVAAMLVNGFSPAQMMQSLDQGHPELRSLQADDIFRFSLKDLAAGLGRLPHTLYRTGRAYLRHRQELTFPDLLWELAAGLPSGLYDPTSLERYVHSLLLGPGCCDRFDWLQKTLYIVATELDTGERAVFGKGGKGVIPISQAVAASSAVPLLYKPYRICSRDYIDGVFRGTASLDLAIEAGAKLVVCINPLTPLDTAKLDRFAHLGDIGAQAIINQVLRILLHGGLRYHVKNLQAKYPDVDIILIEPLSDDYEMFSRHLMHYSARLTIAEHAFKRVTLGLHDNYRFFQTILARHDIQLTRRLVLAELAQIEASGDDPAVFAQVLQGADRRRPLLPEGEMTLSQVLVRLEASLTRLDQMLTA